MPSLPDEAERHTQYQYITSPPFGDRQAPT